MYIQLILLALLSELRLKAVLFLCANYAVLEGPRDMSPTVFKSSTGLEGAFIYDLFSCSSFNLYSVILATTSLALRLD